MAPRRRGGTGLACGTAETPGTKGAIAGAVGAPCCTGTSCTLAGTTVSCTFANALPVGASASVTLAVAVGKAAYLSVTNTATVATTSELLDPANIAGTDIASVGAATLAATGTNVITAGMLLLLLLLVAGASLVRHDRRRHRRR